MELSVGTVVEGKVKQITKFGAFILLPDHSTGMVHISEIAHSFVNDIHDHLTEGQTVMVLVIGNENGKVNLSIKRTLEPPAKPQFSRARPQGDRAPSDRPQGDRPQSARHGAALRRACRAAGKVLRRHAQAVHDRIGQQDLVPASVFRPQDQIPQKITTLARAVLCALHMARLFRAETERI